MTNLPNTPEPEPNTPEPETFRVVRGIASWELRRLISAAPFTRTEKDVSKEISDYFFKKDGWSNCSRADVIEGASICKATLDRVLGDIAVNRTPKRGKPADSEPRPNIWVVVAGRGGNLPSKKRTGTYVASRYFATEEFVRDAMKRLNEKRAEEMGASAEDAPNVVHPTCERITRDGLEFFTIDEKGREVKGSSSPAVETPSEMLLDTSVAAPAVKKPVEAPEQVTEKATVTPVAPAPTAPAPVARVEAPVAPSTRLDPPREWKVSPSIVTTFIGLNATPALEVIEASPEVGAINEAAKSARIAALLAHLPQSAVSDALTLRAKAATASGETPALPEVSGWLIAQLQEIRAEIRNGKHEVAAA